MFDQAAKADDKSDSLLDAIQRYDEEIDEIIDHNIKLFISNIPPYITKQGLINLFQQAGPVANIYIHSKKTSDYPLNFGNIGFVTFLYCESADLAIQLFNGRNVLHPKIALNVVLAYSDSEKKEKQIIKESQREYFAELNRHKRSENDLPDEKLYSANPALKNANSRKHFIQYILTKQLADNKLANFDFTSNLECSFCSASNGNIRKCSSCLLVSYCGKECQRHDWEQHKIVCNFKNGQQNDTTEDDIKNTDLVFIISQQKKSKMLKLPC